MAFNSLYEIPIYPSYTIRSEVAKLSILFMRFTDERPNESIIIKTFNSLYEIQIGGLIGMME